MSHSPLTKTGSKAYRDGWRAVNMLIREGGSWSGRERKTFYRNAGEGRFEDVSFASGLDLPDDGRSWVTLDVNRDGKLDLVMSFRTGPRLRIFQNESARPGLVFDLRGTRSNRDAIGARVTLVTDQRRLYRHVRSGSGFLSQTSRRVHFGLDDGEAPISVEVAWPSGAKRSYAANQPVLVEDGEAPYPAQATARAATATADPPTSLWLAEPVPVDGWENRKTLVALYADWCPPCRAERKELSAAKGLPVEFLNVDLEANRGKVALLSLLHRNLFDLRVDPALPTSFLLEAGNVVKIYKGIVTPEQLRADLNATHRPAYPFPGDWHGPKPRRNWTEAATAFAEHGLLTEAERYLEISMREGSGVTGRNNLAAVLLEVGKLERARALLLQSLAEQPDQAEALVNLGTIELRQGRPKEAAAVFERALRLQPDDAGAHNGLGNAWFASGDPARAAKSFSNAASLAPDYLEYRVNLGSALAQSGQLREALAEFEAVHRQQGDSVELLNHLGILYVETGQLVRGISSFERALKLDPSHAATRTNLDRARQMR